MICCFHLLWGFMFLFLITVNYPDNYPNMTKKHFSEPHHLVILWGNKGYHLIDKYGIVDTEHESCSVELVMPDKIGVKLSLFHGVSSMFRLHWVL